MAAFKYNNLINGMKKAVHLLTLRLSTSKYDGMYIRVILIIL